MGSDTALRVELKNPEKVHCSPLVTPPNPPPPFFFDEFLVLGVLYCGFIDFAMTFFLFRLNYFFFPHFFLSCCLDFMINIEGSLNGKFPRTGFSKTVKRKEKRSS